jgi:hypothetical protein
MSKKIVPNTLLLVTSIYISLLAAEVILNKYYLIKGAKTQTPLARYYPLGNDICNRTIRVEQKEFSALFQYNSHGFRDEEIPITKKNETRFLFLGDSFVEGFGVKKQDRFSEVLLRTLNKERDEKFVGINAGQLATNPINYLHNLVDFGVSLKPDHIFVGIFIGNDFQNGRHPSYRVNTSYKVNKIFPKGGFIPVSWKAFLKLDFLTTLAENFISGKPGEIQRQQKEKGFWQIYFRNKIDKKFFMEYLKITESEFDKTTSFLDDNFVKESHAGKLNPGYLLKSIKNFRGDLDKTEYEKYYNNADFENGFNAILKMSEIAKTFGVKFTAILIPDIYQVYPMESSKYLKTILSYPDVPYRVKNELKELRLQLVEALTAHSINFLDITAALKKSPIQTYHLFDTHLNKTGHAIMSELLYEDFLKSRK